MADAVRARQLHPAAAFAEQPQQRLEARRVDAGLRIGAAHVVDHDRQADLFQDRDRVGQILHVDPELQVPAEILQDRREDPRVLERHAAAIVQLSVAEEVIEAQAAHAERIPGAEIHRRRIAVGDRDAAQPVRMPLQRVEHRCIVAAVRAPLHQRAALEAERVEQARYFASGASGGV